MRSDIKSILTRAPGILLADAVGVVSLVAMLIAALHLPEVF
ncbi:hypothetical protein [Halodurantibacterium flavum]|uniref:DUF1211 domain-containing protein n=1 Tax=Halodurantibacterium flavum TaxID=1382802 RepID=A0ABW4S9Z0_9RHOB